MWKYKKGNMQLEIEQDINSESPREWDNLGIMVCFHRRYKLGDDHDFDPSDFNGYDELEELLYKNEDAQVVLPLYLYDHSGITMSTGRDYPFDCRWDAGQVGFIFARKDALKDWSEEWKQEHYPDMSDDQILTKILKSEVEEYDKYLRGDVYGYTLYELKECDLGHTHKEHVDSCWGFYGLDTKAMAENAGITDIDDWEESE